MSTRKPEPLIFRQARAQCPVCGETSYSAGGIHPQCSVQHADAQRMKNIKPEKKKDADPKNNAAKPWQQACPKCKRVNHVRKKVCQCGHTLLKSAK